MTTSVDPHLVAEISALRPPCEIRDGNWDRCTDPAAWLLTYTARHSTFTAVVPACIGHKGDIDQHRAHCASCRDTFDITAVEL